MMPLTVVQLCTPSQELTYAYCKLGHLWRYPCDATTDTARYVPLSKNRTLGHLADRHYHGSMPALNSEFTANNKVRNAGKAYHCRRHCDYVSAGVHC